MRIRANRRIRSSLHNWKSAWRRDPGSTLDPQNIDGPLPFTSVAFLALAFVRLHIDIGPHRSLETRDPHAMAANLSKMQPPRRGPRVATALLHAVHAMSIPVRMGVDYVARSQMFFWSCQHSICALETGIFVWKWLQRLEMGSSQGDLARKFILPSYVPCDTANSYNTANVNVSRGETCHLLDPRSDQGSLGVA